MSLRSLALQSLANASLHRRLGSPCAPSRMSVTLLLGVEKIRSATPKTSFTNTISGTDLIVGARSGAIQLLLYSVFRIGNATNNISWQSYLDIAANDPKIAWIDPAVAG